MTKQKRNCLILWEVLSVNHGIVEKERKKLVLIFEISNMSPTKSGYLHMVRYTVNNDVYVRWRSGLHWTGDTYRVASADNQFKLSSFTSEHLQSQSWNVVRR